MVENQESSEQKPEKTERSEAPEQESGSFRADNLLRDSKDVLPKNEKGPNPVAADGNVQFSNIFETVSSKQGKTAGDSSPLRNAGKAAGGDGKDLGSLQENKFLLGNAEKPVKASSFGLSGDLSKIDQKKPTVAFLDDKSAKELKIDGQDVSHADISALAAQKGGFNALVLDVSKNSFEKAGAALMKDFSAGRKDTAIESARKELLKSGGDPIGLDKLDKKDLLKAAQMIGAAKTDLATPINEFAEKVKSGEIPMGKGDVLNVSMGDNAAHDKDGKAIPGTGSPTFEELSKKLGFEVTPGNLNENKDRILAKLGDVAKDTSDPEWQKRAETALKTNKAIENVQSTGIEVVHSASNDGNNRVDINFLKANHELQSVDPATGKLDKFSGVGNQSADGVVPIHRTGENAGDKTFSIAGKEFSQSELTRLSEALSPSKINGGESGAVGAFGEDVKSKVQLDKLFEEKGVGRPAPEFKTAQGELAAVAVGNSFANIKFLQEQQGRLRAKKQDAASRVTI